MIASSKRTGRQRGVAMFSGVLVCILVFAFAAPAVQAAGTGYGPGGGGNGGLTSSLDASENAGTLPFTGSNVLLALAVAAVALGAGISLNLLARRYSA